MKLGVRPPRISASYSATPFNTTASQSLAHISLMWIKHAFTTKASTITFSISSDVILQNHRALFSVASARPIHSRMMCIPQLLTTSCTSTAQSQAGQVALPRQDLLDPGSVKIMIKKESYIRHNTAKQIMKHITWQRDKYTFLFLRKRVRSCFRFVLFLTIFSKSPFKMSVTEDKTNTSSVNMILIPPAVGKQINMGSNQAALVNPLSSGESNTVKFIFCEVFGAIFAIKDVKLLGKRIISGIYFQGSQ